MVKNIPTIERSTKVRFGKNALDDQAENTIVFNASNESLNANTANTIYISPVRLREDYDDPAIVLLMYNKDTKEVTESGEAATDIIETTLQGAALRGNVINVSTVYFNNVSHNSLVTDGNVGIVNTNPLHTFSVGSNLYVDDTGSNVLVVNGGVSIDGNLDVKGGITAITSNNLIIEDAIIELGKNNTSEDTTLDLGLIMGRPDSNVTVGFKEETDEIILAFTESSAYSNAIVPLTSEDINVHIYGRLYTESNVGVLNTNPMHTLDVGSNLYVDEFGSNILVVTGNTSVSGDLTVDTDTLFVDSSENKVGIKTVTPSAELHVVGNAYVSSNLNVDTDTLHVDVVNDSIGVGTVNPSANLHVVGNVYVSSNLTVDTDTLHVDVENDSIGVGTVNPSANLHVVGNVYVSSNLTVDTETLHVDVVNDSIGVGTVNPSANLHVVGNAYVTSNTTTDGTLTLNHPTTALITDLTSNVEVKLDQLNSVLIGGENALANEDMLVYDGSNWTNQLQNHTFLYAKAEETIAKGDAVYATGSIGNNMFSIRKAQANSGATMPALGVAYQAFTLNQEGLIVTFGRADGVDTDNFQTGETVYVSNVTAGALSNVKPYGPNDLIQNVGLVVKGNSNGIVNVTGVGRSNDIPNAPIVADESDINYVYVNDANNDLKKILPTNLLTQLQTLQQVTDTGNTTSNTIQFTDVTTGLVTVSNVEVGSNISVAGLADAVNKHVPMVGTDGFLEKSPIYFTPSGTYVVSAAEAEFLGNLTLSGNTTILNSESVTISDRIFGVAANNSASQLDSGFMIEHQEGDPLEYANVALIYHADEHRLSISYTQNTFTDDHILHYEDETHQMLIDLRGNVQIQNNVTIGETLDVTGTVTFADDLTVGAVSNLFVDVSTSRVGINEASPTVSLDVNGDARVQDTTDTTSTSGGALVVSGGLGVASNIHSTNVYAASHVGVGTDAATAPLHLLVSGTGETTNGIYVKNATGSGLNDSIVNLEVAASGGDPFITWNQASGSAFAMGLDSSENLLAIANSKSDLTTNQLLHMTTTGVTTIENTTNSTSKTTGALIVGGGLGVSQDIHGKNVFIEDVVSNSVAVLDTTNATSKTTGAVRVSGGLGVSEDIHGKNVFIEDVVSNSVAVLDTTNATSKTTGAVTISGGLGVSEDIHGKNVFIEDVVSNSVVVLDTTNATSKTTGAVTISGGVGVTGALYGSTADLDGAVTLTDTTEATSSTTGALKAAGGVGIAKDVYVGEQAYITGGLVTNTGAVTKKTYSFSNIVTSGGTAPEINVYFTSNVFYSKLSAQLVDDTDEVSTMVLEMAGGSRNGTVPGKNIKVGTKNIFGDASSTPWSSNVLVAPNRIMITPSGALTNSGNCHVFLEYTSDISTGGVSNVQFDFDQHVLNFGY